MDGHPLPAGGAGSATIRMADSHETLMSVKDPNTFAQTFSCIPTIHVAAWMDGF